MEKLQVLIAIDSLVMGGIQKSLLTLIHYMKDICDMDVLVWHRREPEDLQLPDYVNRIYVPSIESVRSAFRNYGISKELGLSCLNVFRKKRWLILPRLEKQYDVAIAYSHVSSLKYYLIDKVSAKRKYAFYHHGSYDYDGIIKLYDSEYYPKYVKVFAVSDFAKSVLTEALPDLTNVYVLPNLLDIEYIEELAEEPCPEFPNDSRLKLLTVGRLSPEKNPLEIAETAVLLENCGINYIWIVVGDGDLFNDLAVAIERNGLNRKVVMAGNQLNPYRFMKKCDVYLQFSKFEADSLTVKEAAVFNKHMVLSNIPRFRKLQTILHNIYLFDDKDDIIRILTEIRGKTPNINNLYNRNEKVFQHIKEELLYDTMQETTCN